MVNIEAGKYYKTVDGMVRGPMVSGCPPWVQNPLDHPHWVFHSQKYQQAFTKDGKIQAFGDPYLVEECDILGNPPSLIIREGGYYINRAGRVVGPMTTCDKKHKEFKFKDPKGFLYTDTGKWTLSYNEAPGDLIKEHENLEIDTKIMRPNQIWKTKEGEIYKLILKDNCYCWGVKIHSAATPHSDRIAVGFDVFGKFELNGKVIQLVELTIDNNAMV